MIGSFAVERLLVSQANKRGRLSGGGGVALSVASLPSLGVNDWGKRFVSLSSVGGKNRRRVLESIERATIDSVVVVSRRSTGGWVRPCRWFQREKAARGRLN